MLHFRPTQEEVLERAQDERDATATYDGQAHPEPEDLSRVLEDAAELRSRVDGLEKDMGNLYDLIDILMYRLKQATVAWPDDGPPHVHDWMCDLGGL